MSKSAAVSNPSRVGEYEFEFRDWPFYWLAKADRAYLSILEKAVQRNDLDIAGWRVLMILHSRRSASVSELAEHSITKLSTMTKIVQRMESDGLVKSGPNPADRRVTMVHVTRRGELVGERAWHEAKKVAEDAFSNFSEEERENLTEQLKRLTFNLAES